jgi:hypothetical protein
LVFSLKSGDAWAGAASGRVLTSGSPPTWEDSAGGTNTADAPAPATLDGATDDTPLTHTWAAGDLADESSYYGVALVHFEEWTPVESGTILLSAPLWDGSTGAGSGVDFQIFEGAITEVPDREGARPSGTTIADSGWSYHTDQARALSSPATFDVVGGTTYTLAATNWEGLDAVDRVLSLREWALSIEPFGGGPQLFSWRSPDGLLSRSEGFATAAQGNYSHAEGVFSEADGLASHAEGYGYANGDWSHAEGAGARADGEGSHAEGVDTLSDGNYAHAEGSQSHAEGYASHAEGVRSHALTLYSHAEGVDTLSDGNYAHAEGNSSRAQGSTSHAEGDYSHAEGDYSHAEGSHAHARNAYSHARGGGQFAAPGDSQYLSTELKQTIFGLGGTFVLPLAAERIIALRGMVAARAIDGTIGAAWLVKAALRTDALGVTPAILGTPNVERLGGDTGTEAWDITIAPGGSLPHSVRLLVAGTDGLDAHWSMTLETKECG